MKKPFKEKKKQGKDRPNMRSPLATNSPKEASRKKKSLKMRKKPSEKKKRKYLRGLHKGKSRRI